MNILVFPHLGLGDQIIMNGYINFLLWNKNIKKITIIAKKYQEKTLTHLYSDSHIVTFFWIDIIDESSPNEWLNTDPISAINGKPFNTQILFNNEPYFLHNFGVHSSIHPFIVEGRTWADSFYLRAGVEPSLRYDLFKLPTNLERSIYLYMLLKDYIQSDNYILIHDDPSRGRVIESDLVKSILENNSTLSLPIVYLGKNRERYPFIKGLNNISPFFPSNISSLDFYHIILHATECHFMDSSFAALTDTMNNYNTKLYLHYYMTDQNYNLAAEIHSKNKWTFLYNKT
jgi:hypothetical protein